MTTILLIRHGQNDFVGKRLAGRLPVVHLNQRGREQAQAVADFLKDAPVKAIYSSPLERAVETAEPLAKICNIPIQIHPGLLEVDFGDWQGKTFKQLHRLKLWKTVQHKPSDMRFPNGETFAEAQARAAAAIEEIAARYEENDLVACFSHSDTIRLAVCHFLMIPLDAFQRVVIDTSSLTTIHLHEERVFVGNVNLVPGWTWPKPQEQPAQEPDKKIA